MAVNLVNRSPVPGSLGAPVGNGVQLTVQVSGGGSVALSTVIITIDSVVAYTSSAFQTNFTGTATSDGLGGWIFDIQPTGGLPYNKNISVQVTCTEQPGNIPFNQIYSFHTIRNIQLSVSAEYVEEGDIVNILIYPYENGKQVTPVVQSGTVSVYNQPAVPSMSPVLFDTFVFNNERNSAAADGSFFIKFLHPLSVTQLMTFNVSLNIDPYQAPNVNNISASGNITYTKKPDRIISEHTQPFVQTEIHRPRIEMENGNLHKSFQIEDADYQSVTFENNNLLPDLLVDIDLLQGSEYANVLTGDVSYTGGGNRILNQISDGTKFTLQQVNEFAPLLFSRTIFEPTRTNLLPNSAFLESNDFTVTGTDSTVIRDKDIYSFLVDENQDPVVNLGYFLFEGTTTFDGVVRHASATSPKVGITTGKDVLISSLIRIEYRDATVTLRNFNFIAKFFNSSDAQVYTTQVTYSPSDFVSDSIFSMAEILVPAASIPLSATKVSFTLDFDSFEACDLIRVFLFGPCVEYAAFTTSRIVGAASNIERLPDALTINQAGNVNIKSGMVTIDFSPLYDIHPPVDAVLFDSRTPSTLLNGFSAKHRSDGFIEFNVVDATGATQTLVSTSAITLALGEPVSLSFGWGSDNLFIRNGSTALNTYSGAYSQPTGVNTLLYIGTDSNVEYPCLSEVSRFRIFSRPLS